MQIAGSKGVRFSPQISYQLDRRSIWRTRLPETFAYKDIFYRVLGSRQFDMFLNASESWQRRNRVGIRPAENGVRLRRGSNIFLGGEGSGGKAALAMKIAVSPAVNLDGDILGDREKILVVSFLYPREYYVNIRNVLLVRRRQEYGLSSYDRRPVLEVMHLYPGNYLPDQLFNRIEWALEAAELSGESFTTIILDGLHNVFLQFPEIEAYSLFWPQLYASLRSRRITIISTHTTFVLQGKAQGEEYRLDDKRSEPLRHALVVKTDYSFEVDPLNDQRSGYYVSKRPYIGSGIFTLKTLAAIDQRMPDLPLLWSREKLLVFTSDQGELPFN